MVYLPDMVNISAQTELQILTHSPAPKYGVLFPGPSNDGNIEGPKRTANK